MNIFHVLAILSLSFIQRSYTIIDGLTCDLNKPCTTSTGYLKCQLLDLDKDMMAILSFHSNSLGPSEPTNLHIENIENGDRGRIRVKWKGPDDSSSRDLIGFKIEVSKRGGSFKQYIMDLRGNSITQQKAMKYVYELCCVYDNPFSQKMSVDVVVTSLPINDNSTEKSVQLNEPIFAPKYMYSSSVTNRIQLKEDNESGINNTVIIVPSTIVAVVILIGIIIYLKFKVWNRRVNHSLSDQTSNSSAGSTNENDPTPKSTNGGSEHYIPYLRIETINTQLDNHSMYPHQSPYLGSSKYDIPYSASTCCSVQPETGSVGISKAERDSVNVNSQCHGCKLCFDYIGNRGRHQDVYSSKIDRRSDSCTGSEVTSECSGKESKTNSDEVLLDSKLSFDTIKCVRFQEPESLSDSESLNSESLTQEMLRINNMTPDYTC